MSLLALLLSVASALPAQDNSRPLRRFLLAAASNDGGPGMARLRFSGDDAQGIVSVMTSLGGVSEANSFLVLEPDTGHFLSTLREVSLRMAAARDSGLRVELMLYYSGHSDEEGLLLGSTRLPYAQLRQVLQNSPAEIRLAVLDACASGAALRTKGGIRREAFRIEGADGLRGVAFLTSSRAEESSQESDQLKGSFFTQAFLAGLRGAADADGDGRITLQEAYNYAYKETVENTSSTRTGPQHPEFDIDLSGSGDVVLTDLSQAGAVLELPAALSGHIDITDSTGAAAADLDKHSGRSLSIGLHAGTWRIAVTDSARVRVHRTMLRPGSHVLLSTAPSDSILPLAGTTAKDSIYLPPPDSSLVEIPVNLGLIPPLSVNGRGADHARNMFSLDILKAEAARIDGLQISTGYAQTLGAVNGVQIAYIEAKTRGDLNGAQVSLMSLADEGFHGAQLGGLWASSSMGGQGVQIGGLVATQGGEFSGFQGSGLVGYSAGDIRGVQASTVTFANSIRGAQLAVLNIGGSVTGLQAGVVNIARSVHGSQLGVLNISGSSNGAQLGVLNIARTSHGAQVGALNIADTSIGADVGVLNYANDLEAAPVGVISACPSQESEPLDVETWLEESGWVTVATRVEGPRYAHGTVASLDLSDPSIYRLGIGFGWGAHWTIAQGWKLDADYFGREMLYNTNATFAIRSAEWNDVSLSLHRGVGPANVFVGISCNVLVSNNPGTSYHFVNLPWEYQWDVSRGVRIWPGAFVGVGI
jgi:hypothetical protein